MALFGRKKKVAAPTDEAVPEPTLPEAPEPDGDGRRTVDAHRDYVLGLVQPLPPFGMALLDAWGLALCESVRLHDGTVQPLWGLLGGQATLQKRLAALGPQQLAVGGQLLRGHTFHYSTLASSAPVIARSSRPGEASAPDAGEALYRMGSLHASYFHAWFASSPRAVAHLLGGEGA